MYFIYLFTVNQILGLHIKHKMYKNNQFQYPHTLQEALLRTGQINFKLDCEITHCQTVEITNKIND